MISGVFARAAVFAAMGVMATSAVAGQQVKQQPPGQSRDRANGSGATDAKRDLPGGAARGKNGRATVINAKYDAGMAAIRANQPGKAVEMMRPLLADFEKQYAEEKRDIFCALTPEQSTRYLADAAKANRPAVTIDSGWCRVQYVTGYALIDLDKLPEAQTVFERLVRYAPQHSRYLNELGYILLKQKKWQQSLEIYRRAEVAADLSPDRVDEERCLALKGVGYDLIELGDFNAAEAAYRKCLNINPDDEDSPRELKYIEEQRKLTV